MHARPVVFCGNGHPSYNVATLSWYYGVLFPSFRNPECKGWSKGFCDAKGALAGVTMLAPHWNPPILVNNENHQSAPETERRISPQPGVKVQSLRHYTTGSPWREHSATNSSLVHVQCFPLITAEWSVIMAWAKKRYLGWKASWSGFKSRLRVLSYKNRGHLRNLQIFISAYSTIFRKYFDVEVLECNPNILTTQQLLFINIINFLITLIINLKIFCYLYKKHFAREWWNFCLISFYIVNYE